MTMQRNETDAPVSHDFESSIPTLSDDSRSLIEGRIEPERYIVERREHAEQYARRVVERTHLPPRSYDITISVLTGAGALAAALLSFRGELSWLGPLTLGVVAVSVAASVGTARLMDRHRRNDRFEQLRRAARRHR
jgi:hypothetical protein